jgi:aminoglycoside 6'-N-acetyltransferase
MQLFDTVLPLISNGTCLRKFRADDVARFHGYRSDPVLAVYQGWSPMAFPEAQAFVEEMCDVASLRLGEWIQLAIADAKTDELLGDIGLLLDPDGAAAELGFTLCRSAQGQGHATRAARAATSLTYATSTATSIRAVTDARNVSSVRTLELAAFKFSHSQKAVFKGEPCTELVYIHRPAVYETTACCDVGIADTGSSPSNSRRDW